MNQGLGVRRDLEVIALQDQLEVDDGKDRGKSVGAERREVLRRVPQRSGKQGDYHHQERGGGDPRDPPLIEAQNREAPAIDLIGEQRRDQESRNDEEYVDADETAAEQRGIEMKRDDREDGDRPQAGDFRPIGSPVGDRGLRGFAGRGRGVPAL